MANNFEAAAFALQCAFPKNKILMDDKGMPSTPTTAISRNCTRTCTES